jgi:hypothetical protein
MITIKIEVPENCTVRLEGASTGCNCSRPTGSTPASSAPPRSPSGAQGEGDGSASEKQRKLVYARCKNAEVEVAEVLRALGLEKLDQLGWKDVEAALEILASGSRPPEPAGEPSPDADSVPF